MRRHRRRQIADAAESDVPMPGYTVPYAIGNTLVTARELVIVQLMPLFYIASGIFF